ncbi:hypothetical protein F5X68DRAFT_253886 [Plectosphaerella plurivora]|uniref:Uncharacterized protein n=1 Tax=Plectosphaerella plurivora TaxID=936078 RepID=A0A9P8VET5_9PEZI|nr:hypothetical protein F5X68DRAFT_253886 [Plectosphaerella plurivora]
MTSSSPRPESAVPLVQLGHICSPIPTAVKIRIADALWSADQETKYVPPIDIEPYFEYHALQCKTMYHALGGSLPFSSHDGIVQIAEDLKEQGLTRDKLYLLLDERYPKIAVNEGQDRTEVINGAIDLVARLLLMVDVGQPTTRMWTGREFRLWEQGTIREFAATIFPEQRSSRHDGIRLDRDFNARNLYAIGGLKVELTNNLLDHLEVVDVEGETTVMIFHHVSFLKNQQKPLFPEGLVEETLQTLALLFPQNRWYGRTRHWYRRDLAPAVADADEGVLSVEPSATVLEIDGYHYWHDRLVRLKLVYDQSKPRTVRQWWNDRREGSQWYALWVVLGFTVFFGLVQSIEGALQVYKAYNPGDEGGGKGA